MLGSAESEMIRLINQSIYLTYTLHTRQYMYMTVVNMQNNAKGHR